MEAIHIRQATSQDNSRIKELGKELGDFHKALDDEEFWAHPNRNLVDYISKDDSTVLVAEDSKKIVSYCLVSIISQPPEFGSKLYGYINELLVTGSHRGQGIGAKMVHEAEDWFRSKGIYQIEVGVVALNDVAAAFWQKMGYVPGLVLRNKEI